MSNRSAPRPVLSCVMIFLDGSPFIDAAIRSVVEQEGFDEWELILVDDGSTDESTAIARSWADRDARIRYLEHPDHANRGMSESRNLGVTHASGSYVTFLDCDDIFLPSNFVHRMRIATALPEADVIISAVWWWHTWQGPEVASPPDFPLLLPDAPVWVLLDPPRLFRAIYGNPGGAHAPAICGQLFRSEALLAIGGLEPEFTDMYEDQVLNVKAGLKLRAVIDPRLLALYRQHPDSACALAMANGDWQRSGPSTTLTRFHDWSRGYVAREAGIDSEDYQIVLRDIRHSLGGADPFEPGLRGALRRHAPETLKGSIRRVRALVAGGEPRVPVLAAWSEQFLEVTTIFADGEAAVLLPARGRRARWTGDIPGAAFGAKAVVSRLHLDDPAGGRFDHVLVPFDAAASTSTTGLLDVLERRLRRGGSVAAVVPGPAWPTGADGPHIQREDAGELRRLVQQRFPEMRVTVETFGNEVTAAAVGSGLVAGAVDGVAIDHHDPGVQVMLALSISPSDRLAAAIEAYRPIGYGSAPEMDTAPRSVGTALDRLRTVARNHAPESIKRIARRSRLLSEAPPVGRVRFGDLRRTTPIAHDFGYRRGGPVDRHYIEAFLEQHRTDVRGRVLEVGDSAYTKRYGDDRVVVADVLHVDPQADEATFVGDLAEGSFLPDDSFDCIVLTQTLHLIYDFAAALRTVARILAPGGVLLMTVPGITNIDGDEWGSTWHYSFSPHSVRRMCAETFDGFEVAVSSHGNVLAAVAFLHGLGAGELSDAELETRHVEYSLIHAARIRKPAHVA